MVEREDSEGGNSMRMCEKVLSLERPKAGQLDGMGGC